MKTAYIVQGYRTAVGKAPRGLFRFKRPDELAAETIEHSDTCGRICWFMRSATQWQSRFRTQKAHKRLVAAQEYSPWNLDVH